MLFDKIDDVIRSGSEAVMQFYRRMNSLALFEVIQPKQNTFTNCWVPSKHRFNITWINIKPASHQYITNTVFDEHIAAQIDLTYIA